jgi:hypothetical protein
VRHDYDFMSEFAHPNLSGVTSLFAKTDRAASLRLVSPDAFDERSLTDLAQARRRGAAPARVDLAASDAVVENRKTALGQRARV